MVEIPQAFRDLLDGKKAFANVATVLSDGSPQVTPVWFDTAGGKLRINTAKGRVKSRTMKEGAKVAMAIMDPDNPYRYIQIRGTVTRATEEGADAHIDKLAKKYLGQDKYPYRQPGEQRIMFEITPEAVQTMAA
jgi:PPOX class probable F420-dependent enzyme